MEQLLIYIVLGVGYLLLKGLGKANKKQPNTTSTPPPPVSQPSSRPQAGQPQQPASLEELLERFNQAKERNKPGAPAQASAPKPPVKRKPEPTYRNLEEEALQKLASNPYAVNIPLTSNTDTGSVRRNRDKRKERRTTTGSIAKLLNSKKGLKQAILMKEILDRKY